MTWLSWAARVKVLTTITSTSVLPADMQYIMCRKCIVMTDAAIQKFQNT